MERRFDQRTLAVLAAETGAIPLLLTGYVSPEFLRPGVRWLVVLIVAYTIVSVIITVAVRPLNDTQFAVLSFGGMLGVVASACVVDDSGSAHAVLALLAVIPAIAAMESPPRTVIAFVVVAAGMALCVVSALSTSIAALVIGGGAVVMAIVVPTYLVTTLRRSLSKALAQQELLSETDPLTQILNRRGLADRWTAVLHNATTTQRPVGFIEADVDFFKEVNDREGHSVGDSMLVDIAKVLRDAAPETALVARTGGEEFVVVDAVADEMALTDLCERLRACVAARTDATISIGAVVAPVRVHPGHPSASTQTMLDELLAVVDQQLYTAKRRGRNCVALTRTEIMAGDASGQQSDEEMR
ncbi:GGDEF domain-containing protein [Gordonia sp. CPCC 205515]|uniref:GGDEF domain-containing protein n=1 Tax=Gordonia sp. CPCC 205515 TaxID=3140791 RepID=UPI003AF363D5